MSVDRMKALMLIPSLPGHDAFVAFCGHRNERPLGGSQVAPLSKPARGQNRALRAAPAGRASTCLVSAFLVHSTPFCFQASPNLRSFLIN